MLILDKEKLHRELSVADREDTIEAYDESQDLRTLFLLLANDPREMKKTTMGDVAELFNDTARLLSVFTRSCEECFNASLLSDVRMERRVL